MSQPDYNDPIVVDAWCDDQRRVIADYLRRQNLTHGRIGESPAWHAAPYVAIWAIESVAAPGWIGWWAISGDLPTDYISSADVAPPQHPRKAARIFARNWSELAEAWKNGREVENSQVGDAGSHAQLAPLLEARAKMLAAWTEEDSLWEGE